VLEHRALTELSRALGSPIEPGGLGWTPCPPSSSDPVPNHRSDALDRPTGVGKPPRPRLRP
jgi:hypothetical protein